MHGPWFIIPMERRFREATLVMTRITVPYIWSQVNVTDGSFRAIKAILLAFPFISVLSLAVSTLIAN